MPRGIFAGGLHERPADGGGRRAGALRGRSRAAGREERGHVRFGLGPSRVGPQTSRPLGAFFLVAEYGRKTVQNLKSFFAILRINFLMLDSVRDLANFLQS